MQHAMGNLCTFKQKQDLRGTIDLEQKNCQNSRVLFFNSVCCQDCACYKLISRRFGFIDATKV